jgi:hypothetical protein
LGPAINWLQALSFLSAEYSHQSHRQHDLEQIERQTQQLELSGQSKSRWFQETILEGRKAESSIDGLHEVATIGTQ